MIIEARDVADISWGCVEENGKGLAKRKLWEKHLEEVDKVIRE